MPRAPAPRLAALANCPAGSVLAAKDAPGQPSALNLALYGLLGMMLGWAALHLTGQLAPFDSWEASLFWTLLFTLLGALTYPLWHRKAHNALASPSLPLAAQPQGPGRTLDADDWLSTPPRLVLRNTDGRVLVDMVLTDDELYWAWPEAESEDDEPEAAAPPPSPPTDVSSHEPLQAHHSQELLKVYQNARLPYDVHAATAFALLKAGSEEVRQQVQQDLQAPARRA